MFMSIAKPPEGEAADDSSDDEGMNTINMTLAKETKNIKPLALSERAAKI